MTFEEIFKLPEGTCLCYDNTIDKILGRLYYHENIQAVFKCHVGEWTIGRTEFYSIVSDEEAMLWKLEN